MFSGSPRGSPRLRFLQVSSLAVYFQFIIVVAVVIAKLGYVGTLQLQTGLFIMFGCIRASSSIVAPPRVRAKVWWSKSGAPRICVEAGLVL